MLRKRGTCQPLTCPAGQDACMHACVDVLSNFDHCGECWTQCGSNQECANGACQDLGCGAMTVACEGQCVPLEGEHCLGSAVRPATAATATRACATAQAAG